MIKRKNEKVVFERVDIDGFHISEEEYLELDQASQSAYVAVKCSEFNLKEGETVSSNFSGEDICP